jgi:hypothetical protein
VFIGVFMVCVGVWFFFGGGDFWIFYMIKGSKAQHGKVDHLKKHIFNYIPAKLGCSY